MGDFVKIALTGGPCAGKTSARKFLQGELDKIGWSTIFVPEVATTIIAAGLRPMELNEGQRLRFQYLLIELMLSNEERIYNKALEIRGGDRRVMICDRGVMDAWAYMNDADFKKMLGHYGLNAVSARDKRYDAVFHLVTAADGAVEHYNTENSSRFESPEDAIKADRRTQNAWLGHPHLRIVDNSTDFDGKIGRLLAKVKRALGIPVPLENERKYLVRRDFDISRIPVPNVTVRLEQAYLPGENQLRARWREQEGDGSVYYKTRKIPTGTAGSNQELEEKISPDEYWRLYRLRDLKLAPIIKRRAHFIYDNRSFELDDFLEPEWHRGLKILEIELDSMDDPVTIPPWLGGYLEVTDDPRFKNYNLALKPA